MTDDHGEVSILVPTTRRRRALSRSQLVKAVQVAREEWGDAGRVVLRPDGSIYIERANDETPQTKFALKRPIIL